jgi:hypothetical protein
VIEVECTASQHTNHIQRHIGRQTALSEFFIQSFLVQGTSRSVHRHELRLEAVRVRIKEVLQHFVEDNLNTGGVYGARGVFLVSLLQETSE